LEDAIVKYTCLGPCYTLVKVSVCWHFCILHDSRCACPDPSQSKMCTLAIRIRLESKIQMGRKPVHSRSFTPRNSTTPWGSWWLSLSQYRFCFDGFHPCACLLRLRYEYKVFVFYAFDIRRIYIYTPYIYAFDMNIRCLSFTPSI
jgi:hypothetical protein